MPSTATTVKAYLDELAPERRKVLSELRRIVKASVPKARETMKYNMPTYMLDGRPVCSIAAQKHYFALYVCDVPVLTRHAKAFGHLNCGKSCIRFKKLDELPMDAVRTVLREAASEAQAAT